MVVAESPGVSTANFSITHQHKSLALHSSLWQSTAISSAANWG